MLLTLRLSASREAPLLSWFKSGSALVLEGRARERGGRQRERERGSGARVMNGVNDTERRPEVQSDRARGRGRQKGGRQGERREARGKEGGRGKGGMQGERSEARRKERGEARRGRGNCCSALNQPSTSQPSTSTTSKSLFPLPFSIHLSVRACIHPKPPTTSTFLSLTSWPRRPQPKTPPRGSRCRLALQPPHHPAHSRPYWPPGCFSCRQQTRIKS